MKNENNDTLFKKIITREIPAEIVYEDELCLAFKDIHPQAPIHILLIPKKQITQLSKINKEDTPLLGHLLSVVNTIAKQEKCLDAYRLVINNGADVGQTFFHLHMHILAGRNFSWPPG